MFGALEVGAGSPIAVLQMDARDLDVGLEILINLDQLVVARQPNQTIMQLAVEFVMRLGVVVLHGGVNIADELFEFFKIFVGDVAHGRFRGELLQRATNIERVGHLFDLQACDVAAAARPHFHQPGVGQPANRLPALVEAGAVIVDTRSAERFAAGHVAGTLNIPIEWLGSWAGWLLQYDEPFYLIVEPGDLKEAIHGLTYIGLDEVVGYFEAHSLEVLAEHGVELETYDMATPEELADDIDNGDVVLVDVRGKSEWEEGHIPGAKHYMLGYLLDTANEIINGKPIVVQCQTGGRAAIGASILQAKGAGRVINMTGGFNAWETAGKSIQN